MNKTAKSFGIVTLFSIATRLISFIFKMWMSHTLGAEVVGQYQIALSVLMMLFTLTAGAPTVLSRKIAEANSNIKKQNALLTASVIMGVASSAIICAIFYALGNKISPLFSNPQSMPLFFIMLPTLLTSTLYGSIRSWFWGRKKFVSFSSTELLDEIIKIALSALFASGIISSLTGATGIALAMTISDLVCVIVLAIIYFASGGKFAKPTGFKDLTMRTLPLSATRIITALVASLTAFVVPKLLVKSGMSLEQATAEYGRVSGMALPLIMAPVAFISALSVVLIPDVAELRSKGDINAVKSKFATSMLFSTLIAALFFTVYLSLGRSLGKLLFGDEQAGKFVSYCSLMLFPIATAQATTPMLNSLGKENSTFIHTLAGGLVMLPCIIFLPKYIGVYAMALSSGACFLLTSILNFITLSKEVGAFADVKKMAITITFSLPIALTALFSAKLLERYANSLTAIIVTGVYIVFFFFLASTALKVVDIEVCISLFKPAYTSSVRTHAKPRTRARKASRRA